MKASDFDILIPQAPLDEQALAPRWGVVTQASPLRVKLDGDVTHLPITPASLVGGLSVGHRVLCLLAGRQLIVMGTPGGSGVPAATVVAVDDSVVPAGWLLCDGTVYNIAEYPTLGAKLGNRHGGNGTSTFAVPPYNGKVLVGVDALVPPFSTLGQTGGVTDVTLLEAQIPSHAHTVDANWDAAGGAGTKPVISGYPVANRAGQYSLGATLSTGGGQPHTNLQPYATVNYIIRAY